ncbi:hypothetical protein JTE90_003533 [Oedothorax gibbosus]|uniref:Uncharacterized protein n=1 Tax=Oedothorax gibbosus TaxID=931172 RepID=A0AAV6UQY1_9ARAC|nr:hypothetical protein JTE90_003533 [Oedothorax gibbosus]
MATTSVSDVPPPTTLLSLPPEERRKILLESLREGYSSIPQVSRPVSSKVSRYVSQFTSGRWRERIWFSDESVDSEDLESEMSTPETEKPKLVIFGYNLHSDDYLKEREMMARWNIIERELHFPHLEQGYVQKRDAKTQSDDSVPEFNIQAQTTQDAAIVTEPTTEDVPMEECKESPQKVTQVTETSLKDSVPESSVGGEELDSKVEKMQDGDEGIKQVSSSDEKSKPLGQDSKTPDEIKSSNQQASVDTISESAGPQKDTERQENLTTVAEDSKVVEDSDTEMKTVPPSEAPLEKVKNSESSVLSKESEDLKEVSTDSDSKLAESAETETSDDTSVESGAKVSDLNSKSSAILEVKESVQKIEAATVSEDPSVASSEKVLETSKTTSSAEKGSVSNTESPNVPEVKGPADKMDTETDPEHSKVTRTSETDAEATGTNLRGKRKADSVTEDDPDEKRTKKTSAE